MKKQKKNVCKDKNVKPPNNIKANNINSVTIAKTYDIQLNPIQHKVVQNMLAETTKVYNFCVDEFNNDYNFFVKLKAFSDKQTDNQKTKSKKKKPKLLKKSIC